MRQPAEPSPAIDGRTYPDIVSATVLAETAAAVALFFLRHRNFVDEAIDVEINCTVFEFPAIYVLESPRS